MSSRPAPERAFPRGAALLVACALFMEMLDATVLATALPAIAASFGVEPVAVNAAISAYLLTLAVLVPASGWAADRFGARRVFLAALVVFTLASIACAASTSLPMLIAMRVLQGAGGAMMVPVGRLAVLRLTSKAELVRAIAYLTWPALTAPVLAPVVGGAIVSVASWRWIFLVNVPLGVVGFFAARRLVPDPGERSGRRLDVAGLSAIGVGVAALLIAAESVQPAGSHRLRAVSALGIAVGALVFAVWHLLRTPNPLVRLDVLRIPSFRVVAAGGSLYRAVITAVPFLLPLLFQVRFGWSPFVSGLLVTALFAGNIAIKPVTTPLMRRFGIRTVLVVTGALSVVWLVLLATMTAHTPIAVTVLLLVVSGALRSIGFTAYNSLAFADVGSDALTDANTLHATLQELAAGIGVAVAALTVTVCGAAVAVRHLPAGAEYSLAFVVLALLLAPTVFESARMSRALGAAVSGPAPERVRR
ncbi:MULTISPECIES: MFS transporter [unclassified Rhodococcus (in: high G+C Gram-positive bacteria)]|uniref:MFS transporter n=1 Tax=unclassified Rhodococcus (in: high G+C Gram-positive bacteria) TaxID=192944 RepID=UPI0009288B37|nr:MFS transporter [Rhodococcus sp. M8]OLL20624.1 MFS transporter [Rhodococcus sp. M8]QPG44473.1 MFS transporter [Rhodococcus sp. M8]